MILLYDLLRDSKYCYIKGFMEIIKNFLLSTPNKFHIFVIKNIVFLLCLYPFFRLVGLTLSDGLGANPVEFVERSTGYWALVMLLLTLTLTPIRLLTKKTWSLQLRRMLGLFMFFYGCLHITTYVWLDYSFFWDDIVKDIIKHPYVLVGFSAFLLSIPLALTSNKWMIKRLKEKWKKLHQLVYVIAILGVLHFLWLVKKDVSEPVLFIIILSSLFLIRLYYRCKK